MQITMQLMEGCVGRPWVIHHRGSRGPAATSLGALRAGEGEFIHFPAVKDKKRGQAGVSCARGAGSSVEVTAGD